MSEYLDLLKQNKDYRYLWFGSLISQLGDWFNLIASAGLIAKLTGTGTAVSFLFLVRFMPLFLFSPLAGVLADRYERRHIMIASDLFRTITVLSFLFIRDPDQVWLFYGLTFIQFALSATFTPARSAVLANIVQPNELVPANALDSLTWSTMLAVGSLLGGLVAAIFGISEAFIMDALTFLLSAILVSRITGPIRSGGDSNKQGGWLDFWEGLRYLRGHPLIFGISLAKAGGSLAWGAINVLEIAFATDIFPINLQEIPGGLEIDSSTATLGIIYFITGLGTGLGPLFLRRWLGDTPRRLRWGITGGFGFLALGIFTLSMAPNLGIYTLGTLIRTIGSGTVWVFSAALLQMIVPDQYRGRVFAFEFAALTLTQSISIFWAGFGQDTVGLGVRQVTFTMSVVAIGTGLLWLLFHLRQPADQTPRHSAATSTWRENR